MQFQPLELFSQWVREQIQYFQARAQISKSKNEDIQWNEQWPQLIDNGFVYNLFDQVDYQYFTPIFTGKHHDQQTKRQTLLKQYWLQLDKYLTLKQSKRINPKYLSQQTTHKKQLTSRDYSRTSNTSLETSIIELIKILFYLLVQKHNNNSSANSQQSNIVKMTEGERPNQSLTSSLIVKEDCQEESIRGSLSNQDEVSMNVEKESILTLTDVGNSVDVGRLSGCRQQSDQVNEYDQATSSRFLQRICELSPQVQQQLVTVVQQIEQQQLIQQIDLMTEQSPLIMGQQKSLSHSFLYLQEQQQTTTSTSQQTLKKILYKQIYQISQQNQQLKQKMQQIIEQNLKLQKQLQDNQQQQNQLVNKINQYNYEKEQLFEYLKQQHGVDVNCLQDFIQIVQHVQHQNDLLENTITEIQERNYEIETQNAQKIHTINKNALEITQINQDITKVKSKIVDLRQDIEYLDQFVNGTISINAQLISSVNVDQFYPNSEDHGDQDTQYLHVNDHDSSFAFNKSIDLQARHSFGHVLRENLDIYNEKVTSKTNSKPTHSRVLTDSITGYGPNRSSLKTSQKPSTHKKHHKSSFPPKDQQNIDPTPFQQDELKLENFPHFDSKSHSHVSLNYELKEQERAIEQEKERYKQDLVNSLEQLYKEINDLTKEVTQAKEENKVLEKKNKGNEKKITQLKVLHDAFLKEVRKA